MSSYQPPEGICVASQGVVDQLLIGQIVERRIHVSDAYRAAKFSDANRVAKFPRMGQFPIFLKKSVGNAMV